MRKINNYLRIEFSALLIGLCCNGASAADWTFEPSLLVSEIYRSNVNLAPSDEEDDDWITDINPGFTVGLLGAKNSLAFTYRLQGIVSANDSDRNDVFHFANGSGAFQLVEDRLFLDVGVRYDQENIDPAGQIALDNTFDTDNRTDVGAFNLNPYWRQPLGEFATSTVLYGYELVKYYNTDQTSVDVEDSHSNQINWLLEDASQSRLGWETDYFYRRVEFDEAPEFEYQKAQLQLTWQVGSRTELIAAGGRESEVDKDPSEGNLGSNFWNVGFSWNPTSRDSLEARVGDRFYGTSYELQYQRTGSRGLIAVSYTEDPVTANGAQFDDRVQQDTGSGGTPRLDPEVFLRKRLAAEMEYALAKTDLSLSVFRDKREYEEIASVSDQGDETYWGILAMATWAVSPRMDLIFRANLEREELAGEGSEGGDDDLGDFRLELRRELRPNMALSVSAGHYFRNSDDSFDYTDNSGQVSLEVAF